MTYKPFNPVTQKMDEQLKLAWLTKMVYHPEQYTSGYFERKGCLCALGQLLDVLGYDVKQYKDIYPLNGEEKGRFRICEYYLGPAYERIHYLNDAFGDYHSVTNFVNDNL